MRDREIPLPLLRKWLRDCPDAYGELDNCEAAKADGSMSWPDYCPLPINAAYTYLSSAHSNVGAASDAAELTACWAWRRSRIIYAVDDDMAEMLFAQAEDMADTETVPVELLLHLPYPCIYVKAHHPDFSGMDGFFAWVDYDVNHHSTELRVQWLTADMQHTIPQVLHLAPGWTIGECVDDTFGRIRDNSGLDLSKVPGMDMLTHILVGAVQILLYIVSDGADIAAAPDHKHVLKTPAKPNDVGKASTVDLQYVGVRMGAAIRGARARAEAEDADTTGSTPGGKKRPHARRGHWHHYWTGPQDDRRLILKWTAPTYIHADDMPPGGETVIYPVRKPPKGGAPHE